MTRREFPAKVKAAEWLAAGGRCRDCTAKCGPGNAEYDHAIADGLGGAADAQNCRLLCRACHAVKSATHDTPAIAKAKRREAAHIGAKAPSRATIPGSRRSPFKKRLDGTVVPRIGRETP